MLRPTARIRALFGRVCIWLGRDIGAGSVLASELSLVYVSLWARTFCQRKWECFRFKYLNREACTLEALWFRRDSVSCWFICILEDFWRIWNFWSPCEYFLLLLNCLRHKSKLKTNIKIYNVCTLVQISRIIICFLIDLNITQKHIVCTCLEKNQPFAFPTPLNPPTCSFVFRESLTGATACSICGNTTIQLCGQNIYDW